MWAHTNATEVPGPAKFQQSKAQRGLPRISPNMTCNLGANSCRRPVPTSPSPWNRDGIPPPKTCDIIYRPFHGCSTQGRILLKKECPYYFLCGKVYRSMTSRCRGVEVSRGTPYFGRDDRLRAGFETGDFLNERLGGLP